MSGKGHFCFTISLGGLDTIFRNILVIFRRLNSLGDTVLGVSLKKLRGNIGFERLVQIFFNGGGILPLWKKVAGFKKRSQK